MEHKASLNTSFLRYHLRYKDGIQEKKQHSINAKCNQEENGGKEKEMSRNGGKKTETQFVQSK